jgi:hypothetical protein
MAASQAHSLPQTACLLWSVLDILLHSALDARACGANPLHATHSEIFQAHVHCVAQLTVECLAPFLEQVVHLYLFEALDVGIQNAVSLLEIHSSFCFGRLDLCVEAELRQTLLPTIHNLRNHA